MVPAQSNGNIKAINILTLNWKKPEMDIMHGIRQAKSESKQIRKTVSYRNCLRRDYDQGIDFLDEFTTI